MEVLRDPYKTEAKHAVLKNEKRKMKMKILNHHQPVLKGTEKFMVTLRLQGLFHF